MSGITGLFYRDGRSVDALRLENMTDMVGHRGVDGRGVWSNGCVGLGHRMLWTTPESLYEKLPLTSEPGDLVITADARIDNRQELWAALGGQSSIDAEIADSELILSAYQKWGSACVERLLGDFAFAIWDARKQSFFCARDHFGVRPFYYYLSNNLFAFSSEPKAILCLDRVRHSLNESKIASYLSSTFDSTEDTFYRDIRRLAPAHSLTVNRESVQQKRYWSLDPHKELCLRSDEEYAEGFRELFTRAVSDRLRSAYPVGSMLSGGLDSSSVTCMAREMMADEGRTGLSTYSAVFDTVKESDERPYIDAVLSQNSVRPNFIHGDQISPLVDHERVLWHQDEPLYAFNHSLNWRINGVASDQGVRIMLDGFDGDSTVSHGTGYLVELARSWRWFALASEINGFSKNFNQSPWKMARGLAWQHNISPLIPGSFRKMLRSVLGSRKQAADGPESLSIVDRGLMNRVGLVDRLRASRTPFPLTEREAHHQTLNMPVAPYTLEVLDKAASAFSIEPRYPFFDKRLVEYCVALPGNQKMRRGWTRMVMRRAMNGVLPSKVQWRPGKANLGPSFKHTFLNFEKEAIGDVILKSSIDVQGYVDVDVLRESYMRIQSQTNSHNDVINVWKVVTLALWLRQTRMSA